MNSSLLLTIVTFCRRLVTFCFFRAPYKYSYLLTYLLIIIYLSTYDVLIIFYEQKINSQNRK